MARKQPDQSARGSGGLVTSRLLLMTTLVTLFGGLVDLAAQAATGVGEPDAQLVRLVDGERMEVRPGETFEIAFSLPPQDPDQLEVLLPSLPEGLAAGGGAVLLRRGTRDLQVRVPFRATQPGRFVVDPIRIEYLIGTAEPPFATPPVLVEVADPRSGLVPFQARWATPVGEPVQGQSIPVVLEMEGVDDFLFPDSLTIRAPQTGLFEEVSGLGEVETRDVAGVTLYRIPVAGFIFTPSSAGTVRLPAASIAAAGIQATAPPLDLTVRSSVAPVDTIVHAVGSFDLRVEVQPESLAPGTTGTVLMVIEGSGNLPVLEFPELELDGLQEVDRTQRSTITPDRDNQAGYLGRRELSLRFEADGDGSRGFIRVGDFNVLDPVTDSVSTRPATQREITIQPLSGPVETDRPLPALELLPVDRLFSPGWIPLSRVPWMYLLFVLGPAAYAVAKLLSVRSAAVVAILPLFLGSALMPSLSRDRLQRAAEIAEGGRPAVAAVLYDLELGDHPWHAGLHYNRGVLALRAENVVDATYHLRAAVRRAPERAALREALRQAEEYFATTDQPGIAWYARSDLIVLTLLLLWSLFWGLLAVRGALRRTIALISLGMVALVFAGALGWSRWHEGMSEAVVLNEATVRRIPDSSAQPWLQLQPATAVSVELRFEGFYLVRTTAGVAGWVNEASLWMLDR